MAKTEVVPAGEHVLLSRLGALAEELRPIVATIPETGEDAEVQIIEAILRAETMDDIDAPWSSEGLLEFVNKAVTITGIRRADSDFADGLGFFLIIDVMSSEDGRRKTLTTGSTAVVMQLVKVHALGGFPRSFIPRIPERPSKNGRFPIHLELVRS